MSHSSVFLLHFFLDILFHLLILHPNSSPVKNDRYSCSTAVGVIIPGGLGPAMLHSLSHSV